MAKKKKYEIELCDCGHTVPIEFQIGDTEGNTTCHPCIIEHLQDVVKNKNKVIKSLRNKQKSLI